jgi:hypothetical protein
VRRVQLEKRRPVSLPTNKFLSAAKTGWKTLVMRQVIYHRKNRMLALNMKLWLELALRQ